MNRQLTYLALSLSDLIVEMLGNIIIAVTGKLMGLVIATIGVGMMVEGIKLTFSY